MSGDRPRPSSSPDPLELDPSGPSGLLLCNICPWSKSAADAVNTRETRLPDDNEAPAEAASQFVFLLQLLPLSLT